MNRYLHNRILEDLKQKMVFLTGPRQVGKTYLSKTIQKETKSSIYLNNDDIDDMKIIKNRTWAPETRLVILDEIHKMKDWKNFIKGTFDTRPDNQEFLVTGSARLDTFRRTGESLAGRYYSYRLNPLSVKELSGIMKPDAALDALIRLGGFPEPFLSGSDEAAGRWRRQYFTDIVREDIFDFGRINEINAIKLLLELLRKRVGSPLSYTSLAEDMQVAVNTVKKYVSILESLHVIFIVRPFHSNIARAILREPKVYFYDTGYVEGDEGIKLENTIAVSLLKHVQFIQDIKGAEIDLGYIRTKDGMEVDFAVTEKDAIISMIEVKLSDTGISRNLAVFKNKYKAAEYLQIVKNARHETETDGIKVKKAANWLAGLEA